MAVLAIAADTGRLEAVQTFNTQDDWGFAWPTR